MTDVEYIPPPALYTLEECEAVIERHVSSFVEAGHAMTKIKIGKLYKAAGHTSFDGYCQERWGINRAYGYRLMVAFAVYESLAAALPELSPAGDIIPLPTTERQIRPLASVPDDKKLEVWQAAIESAGGGQPTAEQVENAVAEIVAGEVDDKEKEAIVMKTRDAVRTLAATGQTAQQIAAELGITSSHVCNLAQSEGIALPGSRLAIDQRTSVIAEMAAAGNNSHQIAKALSIGPHHLRREAARLGITIPADAILGKTRNLDSVRIVKATVDQVDGLGIMLDKVDYAALDPEDVKGWLPVLDDAIRSLQTLRNQLKKVSQP